MIKVLIVDDHALVRDGIKAMLANAENIELAGEADDGHEAVKQAKALKPDIILMDIMLPDFNGTEAAKKIKEAEPDIKIIFLSMEVSQEFISEAVKSGASGYLPKDIRRADLISAIGKVYKGAKYFDSSVTEMVFDQFYKESSQGDTEKGSKGKSGKLSKRETEVLGLLASGMSKKDIAEKLFISVRTIDAHRSNILEKLELGSTAEMVKYAIKHNIIQLDE